LPGISPCAFTGPSVQCFPYSYVRRDDQCLWSCDGHKATHRRPEMCRSAVLGQQQDDYDRQTPAIRLSPQDGKRTDAELLTTWFNRDVTGIFKQHHAFDSRDIHRRCLLSVCPDNAHYEGSSRMLFDEHNHPVNSKKATRQQRDAACGAVVTVISLIHTNRSGISFSTVRSSSCGREHECPLLYRMIEQL